MSLDEWWIELFAVVVFVGTVLFVLLLMSLLFVDHRFARSFLRWRKSRNVFLAYLRSGNPKTCDQSI